MIGCIGSIVLKILPSAIEAKRKFKWDEHPAECVEYATELNIRAVRDEIMANRFTLSCD